MTRLQSQAAGLGLAVATAVGCIAYEKLVKACSYFTIGLLCSLAYVPFFMASLLFEQPPARELESVAVNKWWVAVFVASGVTGPLWYLITRKQNVMTGATYEMKFIVLLAVLYWMFGTAKLTWNLLAGIALALCSVWLISKQDNN